MVAQEEFPFPADFVRESILTTPTVRTTSSSFQEDGDNNAWNTFRSWGRVGSFSVSFTDGTLEDATAAEELQDDEDLLSNQR
ncbi:hypothetical protein IV203_025492 [Nitzschia inconspicua]|uniref:Uncharacterized protein n=1 Tax=Nitzschia inconspicua TaxID=303405 RepID=A0A9K3PWT6_9STRA|nr:hypothetical protein IV203_025492 [Nitzschia inconspicua]